MAFGDAIGGFAGTITGGQRKTAQITSTRVKDQVIDGLIYRDSDIAPLYTLLHKLGQKKSVSWYNFRHFETGELPLHVEINDGSGLSDSDTSVVLTTGHGVRCVVGTVLTCERTGEQMLVTAISTDTLTVTRGVNGSSAAAMNDDERLAITGTAMADGAVAPDGVSSEPTAVEAYCQIFKAALELSGRDEAAGVYGKPELARLMQDTTNHLKNQIELAYLFNKSGTGSGTTFSKGLEGAITTNVTNMAGVALDEQSFNTFLKNVTRYNYSKTNKKAVLFAGDNVLEAIETFKRDSLRFTNSDEHLNMAVTGYGTSFGNVMIARHGQFSDTLGSDASYGRWGGRALYLNYEYAGRGVFRPWRVVKDVETPGTDGRKHYMMADEGLWLADETRHGWIKGAASLA